MFLLIERSVVRILLEMSAHLRLAAFAAALLAGACANQSAAPYAAIDGARASERIYRLGVGDKLKVTVFGEDNLSGQVEVNALGQVTMPLAGEVPAKGLSVVQFRDQVAGKLANGYLKNPRVTAEILNYRPIYVQGEVKSGGEFQYKAGLVLRDAVAMAGGYTYRADQAQVLIARQGEPEFSLALPSDVPVLPGDNIRIPERFF